MSWKVWESLGISWSCSKIIFRREVQKKEEEEKKGSEPLCVSSFVIWLLCFLLCSSKNWMEMTEEVVIMLRGEIPSSLWGWVSGKNWFETSPSLSHLVCLSVQAESFQMYIANASCRQHIYVFTPVKQIYWASSSVMGCKKLQILVCKNCSGFSG